MLKPLLVVSSVVLISLLAVFITYFYFFPYSIRIFSTLLALVVAYAVRFFLDQWLAKRVFEKRAQFSFRRLVNVVVFIAVFVAVFAIWVQDVGALFLSTGIIGAGIAIALQDVFRNMAGGLIVLINRVFRIGDRIEVNGKYGDVLDIGLFNTTLLEIEEWIDGDQATGRLTTVPNSFVLSKRFNNYTKGYSYIWDEITIPITYDSDWRSAYNRISAVVREETQEAAKKADQALSNLGERYYLTKRSTDSSIYLKLTDNWIAFKIRYTAEVYNRRTVNSKLSQRILEEIEKSDNIHIASTTLSVSGRIKLEDEK
jgi:small-conductance mechanosensitive channel